MSENEVFSTVILITSVILFVYPIIKIYKSTDKDLEDIKMHKKNGTFQ